MSILLNSIHGRIQEIENRIKKIDELLIKINIENKNKIKNLQKLQELSKNIKDNLIKQKSPSPDYRYQVGYYNLKEYVDELKSVLSKDEINEVCKTIKKINKLRTNNMLKEIIIDKLNTDELEKYLIIEKLCDLSEISKEDNLKFLYSLKQKLKVKKYLLSLDTNELYKLMEEYNRLLSINRQIENIFISEELNLLKRANEIYMIYKIEKLKSLLNNDNEDIKIIEICKLIEEINKLKLLYEEDNFMISDYLNTEELEKYIILEKICDLSKYGLSYEELKFMYILKQKLKKEDLLSLDINQLRRIMERYNGIWTPHKSKVFNSNELNILNKADKKINLQNKIEEEELERHR